MDDRVILSLQARGDIERARLWYSQTGAGPAAKDRLLHIFRAIAELADALYRWPADLSRADARMRVVEGHRVRFSVRADGRIYVLRVFAPWQHRT